MTQEQADRIAKLLNRISDRSEREEVTREICKVLSDADPSFGIARFSELAGVSPPAEG